MQINIDNTELLLKTLYNYLLKLKKDFIIVSNYIDNSFTISYGHSGLETINYNKASNCIYICGESQTKESTLLILNAFCNSPYSNISSIIKYFNLLVKCELI